MLGWLELPMKAMMVRAVSCMIRHVFCTYSSLTAVFVDIIAPESAEDDQSLHGGSVASSSHHTLSSAGGYSSIISDYNPLKSKTLQGILYFIYV